MRLNKKNTAKVGLLYHNYYGFVFALYAPIPITGSSSSKLERAVGDVELSVNLFCGFLHSSIHKD